MKNEIFAVHSGLPVLNSQPRHPPHVVNVKIIARKHKQKTDPPESPIPFPFSHSSGIFFSHPMRSPAGSARGTQARLLGQLTCGQCQAQQVAGKQAGVSLAASCAAIFVAIVERSAALSEPWEGASGAEERGVEGLG